jgi:hypothetical protein
MRVGKTTGATMMGCEARVTEVSKNLPPYKFRGSLMIANLGIHECSDVP